MEPVELTSYTATPPPPAPSSSSVSVSHLLVSWKGEQDKVVLRNIGFEVDQVSSRQFIICSMYISYIVEGK